MFRHKKILILGMARSGYEAAKLLVQRENKVILNDLNKNQDAKHLKELKDLGVKIILGEHPDDLLDASFHYLIKNPGIINTHKYVVKANKFQIPVINEVELAFNLFPKGVRIIGVTGANGKTTTAMLIYELLKNLDQDVYLMGNIGNPVCAFVNKVKAGSILVMEISVQQLCNVKCFKADIAVLTNLYEAHLDFVGSYEHYIKLKQRIFKHQTSNDYAVLNADDIMIRTLIPNINGEKVYFTKTANYNNDSYLKEENLYLNGELVMPLKAIKLKGTHNYENIMAALLVAQKLGVGMDEIRSVLKNFKGVPHRLEYVTKKSGITFYNDSKATNIVATKVALSSFTTPVILLLGGLDRGHSFDELKLYMSKVKYMVAYGETKIRIKEFALANNLNCIVKETLQLAVVEAYELAEEGDTILLSPACASWDQFKDFETRGNLYKKYVSNLKKKG